MLIPGPRRLRLLAPLLACLFAGVAAAGESSTKVSYLAGAMVYASVGSLDGLQVGDTLRVLRAGSPVAGLRVSYVSSHRAACDTLWTRSPVAMGDEIRYAPHAVVAAAPAAPAAAQAPPRPPGIAAAAAQQHRSRFRGRIGARYLSVQTAGAGFRRPSLDLRLDGVDQAGGHVDLSLDVRNRRTVRTGFGTSTTDQLSRIYRATLVLRTRNSHRSVSIGRQTSASLASVSLFDGVLLQSVDERRSFGLFTGTQPDPMDFGLSHEIVESGGFLELHSPAAAEGRYMLTVGGITSQQNGHTNRDFLFLQGSWSTRAVTSTFTQEVDLNRDWKRTRGEGVLSPTSTFWMVRVAPTGWLGINTGLDNRRSVRLYRDRLTPADQFDAAFRQGAWLGSDVAFLNRFRLTGELRGNIGTDASHSWSGGAEVYRLTAFHLSLRGRMSEFTGASVTSRLWSGSFGLDPTPLTHLETSFGVRGTRIAPATTWDSQTWQSTDLDVTLGRHWYLNGGYELDRGGSGGRSEQAQAGLSWRF